MCFKSRKTKIFVVIFLIFSVLFKAFPQNLNTEPSNLENLTSFQLTEALFSAFSEENTAETQKMYLASSTQNFIPQNILISGIKPASSKDFDVYFSFTQEYARYHIDEIKQFRDFIFNEELNFTPYIILTANDSKDYTHLGLNMSPEGTYSFMQQLENTDITSVFLFDETETDTANIVSGNGIWLSPLWMTKTASQALKNCNMDYAVQNGSIFPLGRKNFAPDKRIQLLSESGISAVEIQLPIETDLNKFFNQLVTQIKSNITASIDKHYSYVKISGIEFFAPEGIQILIYLCMSSISLMIIIFMIFYKTEKNQKMLKRLKKTWFYIPLMILFTALLMFLTQNLFSFLNVEPLTAVYLKLLITIILTMTIYILQITFNFGISFRATGYYLLVIGTLNLVIFTTIDLSLMFVFFTEFMIIYIAKVTDKYKIPVAACFIIIFIPLLPYIKEFYQNPSSNPRHMMASDSFASNLLFTLTFTPIQLSWVRIILKFKFLKHDKKTPVKKHILHIAIVSAITLLFFTGMYFGLYRWFKPHQNILQEQDVVITSKDLVKTDYNETEFGNLSIHHVKLIPETDIIQYKVTASTSEGSPIYGSNFQYQYIDGNKVIFLIDSFPQGDLQIDFRSDLKKDIFMDIESYYLSPDSSRMLCEKDSLVIEVK